MKQNDAASANWLTSVLRWVARALLLVPEAALIAALLCAYWALDQPPMIGLALTILIVGFIARTIALVGARMALEGAHPHEAETLADVALALYPWSADGLALRGAIALVSGRPALAEQALQRS